MAQDHELIGKPSPTLDNAVGHEGWGGAIAGSNDQRSDAAEPQLEEIASPDPDFSFRDRHANLQLTGAAGGTFAGDAPVTPADEGSMAGHTAQPRGGYPAVRP